jgi:hypothetical protein
MFRKRGCGSKKSMKLVKLIILFAIAGVVFLSCKHDEVLPEEPEPEDPEEEPIDLGNYTSEHAYNLNVVYFVPSDIEPLENYHERISGIMLHMQDWFGSEMSKYGFGEQTFGLLKSEVDPDYVKVVVIRGENGQDYYPYEGGGGKAAREINDHFAQYPEDSDSKHTIVFMPSMTGDNGWDAGGVPFYGIGKWCYVLDYKNFDMKYWQNGSRQGESLWIGGTIHELGHGLNLPHNQHKATDNFTSMMSWGNHEYNEAPENVRLTFADAIILHNNQVVSKKEGTFYEVTPSVEIKSLRTYADTENLYLRARFESDITVNGAIAYNDPKTNSGDGDYNAITWATTEIINGDSISLEMPLAGINEDYKQYPFDLRLRLYHENGNFTVQSFQYNYVDGVPDINLSLKEVDELSKEAWNVVDFSSEELVGGGEGKGAAINVIDNNTGSFWHSQWYHAKPRYPHFFTIDMNQANSINGFTFSKRGDKFNGRPKDITISVSLDNQEWTSLGSFTLNSSTREILELNQSQNFRYFKVTIESGHDNKNGEDVFFTHLAEIGVF